MYWLIYAKKGGVLIGYDQRYSDFDDSVQLIKDYMLNLCVCCAFWLMALKGHEPI